MFNKVKKSFLVAVIAICTILVLTACTPVGSFTPATSIDGGKSVSGNGGIAVLYGDYVYYVNGYQSSTTAENTYEDSIRIGQIVRIALSDLDAVFSLKGTSDSDLASKISAHVSDKAEVIVPNYYYTSNTTETSLNGLYIFGDRIYITTPNDGLDNAGHVLSSQLKLSSYKLDGSDKQDHYTFGVNTAQIMLSEVSDKVFATYYLSADASINSLEVGSGASSKVASKVSNVKFEKSNDSVTFTNENGGISFFKAGDSEAKEIVANNKPHKDHDHYQYTFTVVSVNKGTVYYTVADANNAGVDGTQLFYADEGNTDVAFYTVPSGTYMCWNNKVIQVESESGLYGVLMYEISKENEPTELLKKSENDTAITLVKVEGDYLHYTQGSVSYKFNLVTKEVVAYAYSLSTTATGWSVPDVLECDGCSYVFTLKSGAVSVVKFDASKKTNSASCDITLKADVK